jgi:steroid delta-isomerase-like uncharacterized protein
VRRIETKENLMSIRTLILGVVLLTAVTAGASNSDVARRVYEEGLSKGIFEVPYTSDFVGHSGKTTFTHAQGIAEAKGWRAAFPDLVVRVDLILAQNDLVSVRWTARGTNTGSGNGIPATGKRVEISGTTIFRFVDGKIAEEWTSGDTLGLLKQLDLLPRSR